MAALLKLDGIDPNLGFSLIWAAEMDHSAVVELLLTVKNINPNIGAPLLCARRLLEGA